MLPVCQVVFSLAALAPLPSPPIPRCFYALYFVHFISCTVVCLASHRTAATVTSYRCHAYCCYCHHRISLLPRLLLPLPPLHRTAAASFCCHGYCYRRHGILLLLSCVLLPLQCDCCRCHGIASHRTAASATVASHRCHASCYPCHAYGYRCHASHGTTACVLLFLPHVVSYCCHASQQRAFQASHPRKVCLLVLPPVGCRGKCASSYCRQ